MALVAPTRSSTFYKVGVMRSISGAGTGPVVAVIPGILSVVHAVTRAYSLKSLRNANYLAMSSPSFVLTYNTYQAYNCSQKACASTTAAVEFYPRRYSHRLPGLACRRLVACSLLSVCLIVPTVVIHVAVNN